MPGNPASAGLCPAGGIHNPGGSKDYKLAVGGAGQGRPSITSPQPEQRPAMLSATIVGIRTP